MPEKLVKKHFNGDKYSIIKSNRGESELSMQEQFMSPGNSEVKLLKKILSPKILRKANQKTIVKPFIK